MAFLGKLGILCFARIEDKGHVRVSCTDGAEQLEARRLVLLPSGRQGEAAIADDTKRIVGKAIVKQPRLLVVASQHNLRSATHSQHLEARIEGFCGEGKALLKDELIEGRQYAGIEADAVLYDQQHLHACRPYVVFQVHAVFHQLDDGEQQFRVSQPAEDVLEDAQVFVLHTLRNAVTERREHHDRRRRVILLDFPRDVEDRVVFSSRHHDDEVHLTSGHRLFGFLSAMHLEESRWEAKSQLCVFREYLLIHSTVVLQHEGIVGICDEKHVVNAVEHQVNEGSIFQRHSSYLRLKELRYTI